VVTQSGFLYCMDADWITSPSARRVLQHEADTRPAWLWSQDGQELLWQNAASRFFLAKIKKHGIKHAPLAVPIKGHVARTIRLGSFGRTSLSRIQFLAGDKPASSTCACTPLEWQDGQPALLVVGVDPIAPEFFAAEGAEKGEQSQADEAPAEAFAENELAAAENEVAQDPIGAAIEADERAYERELDNWREIEGERPDEPVAHEPAAQEQAPEAEPVQEDEPAVEAAPQDEADEPPAPRSRLADLVDRLAAQDDLYTPLTEADDRLPEANEDVSKPVLYTVTGRGFVAEPAETAPAEPESTEAEADLDDLARLDEAVGPVEAEIVAEADEPGEPIAASMDDVAQALSNIGPAIEADEEAPADADSVERVSRYNFDELSRILNDRVGERASEAAKRPEAGTPQTSQQARPGALINLGGETLVLNRLPLGILVFRDQQVLFANRAITEMVGYESVETLRNAGLAAIFPAMGPEGQEAGPVNHLVQRDGTLVPVTARLQSISWQGRPALMLSASTTEVRTGHEGAVRAFAETLAGTRGDGFFEANRAGVISAINTRAAALLDLSDKALEGRPLTTLIAAQEVPALRDFLERPARFAETERPSMSLRGAGRNTEIMLFTQGQAGVITGYFGLVHRSEPGPLQITGPGEAEPALLARISRGVRRPLNTIIGFSDLIRSEAFSALGNERYESYAQDIKTAGHEIAALVDELDDYTRLREGRYLPERASIDLMGLLESCVLRIRQQAGNARVIVRSAISETLPRVTADRASLAQAVLNLLASAIDQTPTGGAVVISAQREDDGSIAIHVRDSSTNEVDMAERFVVFRDGVGRDGQMLVPVRSSVGLALTRSLLAVNAVSLSVDPAGNQGMLFSLVIPADLVEGA
jgi:signal transduction histidine kinase